MPAPTYNPPGVTITEALQPQIVPLLTSTAELVIIGVAQGVQRRTDQLVVELGKTQELPFISQVEGSKLAGEKILKVTNAFKPSEGAAGGGGFAKGIAWKEVGEEFEAIKKELEGKQEAGYILPNTVLNIEYEYFSGNYFNPVRVFNAAEAENRYGAAFNEKGEVHSPLTLAVLKAFENGARSVICQPLFSTNKQEIVYNQSGFITNASAPTEKQQEEPATWASTLEALSLIEAVDIIVPVLVPTEAPTSNASGVFGTIQVFLQDRASEQQYAVMVGGIDTTKHAATYPEIRKVASETRGYASGVYAQQNVIVNTTNFKTRANQNVEPNVGGQYVAAALAGKLAGSPASVSLTRKVVGGFRSIVDVRSKTDKNLDAQEGLLVVEEIRGGTIRVRHGLTIDNEQGIARQELSVVRAKFNLIESVRETLENQIIGRIIADANSPVIVRSAIGAVLSELERTKEIVSYRIPECKISSLEPTTITAAFAYRPAFTLNYIDITFSLDLSNQTVTVIEEQKV